jgi:hypothetical protein
VGRPQLLAIYFLPYLAIAIFYSLKILVKLSRPHSRVFIALFVPCFFYTSYYMAWFTTFSYFCYFLFCDLVAFTENRFSTMAYDFLNNHVEKTFPLSLYSCYLLHSIFLSPISPRGGCKEAVLMKRF